MHKGIFVQVEFAPSHRCDATSSQVPRRSEISISISSSFSPTQPSLPLHASRFLHLVTEDPHLITDIYFSDEGCTSQPVGSLNCLYLTGLTSQSHAGLGDFASSSCPLLPVGRAGALGPCSYPPCSSQKQGYLCVEVEGWSCGQPVHFPFCRDTMMTCGSKLCLLSLHVPPVFQLSSSSPNLHHCSAHCRFVFFVLSLLLLCISLVSCSLSSWLSQLTF